MIETMTEDIVARLEAAMTQIRQAEDRAQQAETRCTLVNAVCCSSSRSHSMMVIFLLLYLLLLCFQLIDD